MLRYLGDTWIVCLVTYIYIVIIVQLIVHNSKYYIYITITIVIYIYSNLVGGWPTPLKNDGVPQLGLFVYSQYMKSHNPFMFQSPPTFFERNWTRILRKDWSSGTQKKNHTKTSPVDLRSPRTITVRSRTGIPWCHGGAMPRNCWWTKQPLRFAFWSWYVCLVAGEKIPHPNLISKNHQKPDASPIFTQWKMAVEHAQWCERWFRFAPVTNVRYLRTMFTSSWNWSY